MVQARRAFLSRGYYDRYVLGAAQLLLGISADRPGMVIDAACGEGHHTLLLSDTLRPSLTVGIDASKKAADLAAKAALRRGAGDCVRFIAGNIFDMPVADGSADAVTVFFAPIPEAEALRVLRPGGLLCVCGAGREHLIELRRAIYDTVRYKDKPPAVPAGFAPAAQDNITYTITPEGDAVAELFGMTPFCQRVGEQRRARAYALGGTEITVSVDVTVFRKL